MDLISVREPSFWLLPGLCRRDGRDGLLLVARDAVRRLREESLQICLPLGRDAPDHAPAFFDYFPLGKAALPPTKASIRSLDVVRRFPSPLNLLPHDPPADQRAEERLAQRSFLDFAGALPSQPLHSFSR